jgi:hypothetical protein
VRWPAAARKKARGNRAGANGRFDHERDTGRLDPLRERVKFIPVQHDAETRHRHRHMMPIDGVVMLLDVV